MKVVANGKHTARSVLLTGATGGIGMELAKRYARPGRTLILWGRNPERLTEIATTCCARGSAVFTRQIDLCDGEAALARLRPIMLTISLIWLFLGLGYLTYSHWTA